MHASRSMVGSFAITTLVACASTPGAQPHDMSAAAHESAAEQHDGVAQVHSAQYDTSAQASIERCSHERADSSVGVCWTAWRNPTKAHLDEAESHRKMAADHRAASQALRDAESTACGGIPDADRDMSPFEHREDIASVTSLEVGIASGKYGSPRMEGAVVTLRAVPGMTAQWLQRVVDCHLARNAALGHVVPEMPSCPLVLKGVTAMVEATQSGFAVAVRSEDSATAHEILQRAQALVGR